MGIPDEQIGIMRTELENLRKIKEAAKLLYEEVEMAESIGICLPDRVPALNLGELLS